MIWYFLQLVAVLVALLFVWPHRWLVRDGLKYLLRWPLLGGDGLKRAPLWLGREGTNVYLHFIRLSDGPAVHSHPWDAKALILWGRYADTRQFHTFTGGWTDPVTREYGPGQVNVIPGGAFHTLQLKSRWALTLCWTAPKHGRDWGFRVGDKVVNASGRGAAAYDEANRVGL